MDPVDLFKELLWDNIVKAVLAQLFLKIPLLGWGPIGYVISAFAVKYSDEMYDGIRTFLNLEQIAFKNEELESEYNRASLKLKIVAHGYGWVSPEFEEARDENKKQLSQFVRFAPARAL